MDIKERIALSKRLSVPQHIPAYRELLRRCGSRHSSLMSSDKAALAKSMMYELLGYYTAEQIRSFCEGALDGQPASVTVIRRETVKKKFQNLKNIRESIGRTLTGKRFRQLTASIQIGSIFSEVLGQLKRN